MRSVIRHAGTWTVGDRIASPWHYLPVEVRPGTSALRVALSYARDSGAVLDLGCLGPLGFRGWSGSARASLAISAAGATPGYLPGPVEPGLWHVVIGLHALPPGGARFEVVAETISASGESLASALAADGVVAPGGDPARAPRPPRHLARRELPAAAGRAWLAGDLHAHTVHSDGAMTVAEVAAYAVRSGLDFAAITDHNTISHHAELPAASARYGVILIPGQEVTTAGGHAGILGETGWIDFRRPAGDWLLAAERAGGLMSVNHPFAGTASWLHPMTRKPPLLEVWHWSWLDLSWTTPLSWWQAWDSSAVPVGGSDWHRPGSDAPLGTPTTWVESADPSVPAILAGLRAGRVAISGTRDGPVLLRHDGNLVAIGADGLLLAGPEGPCRLVHGDLVTLPGRPGYHRLLAPAGATLALTP